MTNISQINELGSETVTFVWLFTLLSVFSIHCFGDCAQISSSKRMKESREVFIGRPVEVDSIKNPYNAKNINAQKTRFKVFAQFKGKDADSLSIVSIPSSEGPEFSKGDGLYLVYANKGEGGHLWAHGCATSRLSNWELRP